MTNARSRLASAFGVAACAWVVAPTLFLADSVPPRGEAAVRALVAATAPEATVLQSATGVTAGELELLRRFFAADGCGAAPHRSNGRLVCYYPVDTLPETARPAATERLDVQRQIWRNLLYPHPRDAQYAANAAALAGWIEPGFEGRLLVVDLDQTADRLPVAAEFDLVHQQPVGLGRIRYWSLRKRGQ